MCLCERRDDRPRAGIETRLVGVGRGRGGGGAAGV